MSTSVSQAYQSIANVNLWLKLQSGDQLVLTDVPAIIPLRWTYFQQNWNTLLPGLLNKVSAYIQPDLFKLQLAQFTSLINVQGTSGSTLNPLTNASSIYQFYTVFDNITIQSINLSNQESTLVKETITIVSQYGRNDFLTLQNNITGYRDMYADQVGLTDATYNSTFDRIPVASQTPATVANVQYMSTLQNASQTIDFILANLFAIDTAVDPFALARANANNPAINIGDYSSGQLVRFNYGDTLESLANRYLGDAGKWVDIALANGLQEPYIDEVGTTIPFLTNANGNEFNVAAVDPQGRNTDEELYVNQTIFLQSTTQPFPDQRMITKVVEIPNLGGLVITVNGASNLSQYTTLAGAYVRIYAPDTVNSSQFILIPSTLPLSNPRQETVPWFLANAAEDAKRAGIDLLLSPTDDLVFTANHDIALSYGINNDVQAMRLKIVTELGELRYHQGFGLVSVIGNKNNNIAVVKNAIVASITNQVAQDSRFDRIESLNVNYLAGANTASMIVIELSVKLAGNNNQVIPISFSVNYT